MRQEKYRALITLTGKRCLGVLKQAEIGNLKLDTPISLLTDEPTQKVLLLPEEDSFARRNVRTESGLLKVSHDPKADGKTKVLVNVQDNWSGWKDTWDIAMEATSENPVAENPLRLSANYRLKIERIPVHHKED